MSIDVETAVDKIQHLFIIKILIKIETEGHLLILIKIVHKNLDLTLHLLKIS